MMKLINSKYVPRASGMSILALLIVFAVLMICALPSAHAQVTNVTKSPYEPRDGIVIVCAIRFSGDYIYPLDGDHKRAACRGVESGSFTEENCIAMCKQGGSHWIFDYKTQDDRTCLCKYV